MQHARGNTVSGGQSHTARILLANDVPGRARYDTYMQRLSNTLSRNKKPPAASNLDHDSVAVLQIEVKAVATITGSQVKKFKWDNIVCHFGLPGEIVSDNGKQFSDNPFKDCAAIHEAKAKLKMTKYYNARVYGVAFKLGDFVYCSNDASHVVDGGKLGPKREGPYEVTEAQGDGAYKLRSMDRIVLPRMWNNANLKKCYL
nr:reverse transcriptase domain-containing protein [Tanacetum cinerariifolium]